jgi:hypothetical protein
MKLTKAQWIIVAVLAAIAIWYFATLSKRKNIELTAPKESSFKRGLNLNDNDFDCYIERKNIQLLHERERTIKGILSLNTNLTDGERALLEKELLDVKQKYFDLKSLIYKYCGATTAPAVPTYDCNNLERDISRYNSIIDYARKSLSSPNLTKQQTKEYQIMIMRAKNTIKKIIALCRK